MESDASPWRRIAGWLDAESNVRERRLRLALSFADVAALGIALLTTVVLASPDPLTVSAFLLFAATVGAAKILGLYKSDDQRIRKTTVEELPGSCSWGRCWFWRSGWETRC